ncbi:uncharacterized protein LOC105831265 [Monomorium pharaonis]|uniref:uncharacterized protein LOC105831265 n=1 Tax=Monomorium pharaonis TaxID=307658 RepID=UPI00063F4029|nr:uncharacterized protein LOC105831265 [Monomorium pharaonis]XP_028050333.1 uncharacterized protein LOC105831265 [Monomorium pharaonis]
MNVQNKPNIYTINNAAPPSYDEATGSSTSTPYNPQFDQRYPPVVVGLSSSGAFTPNTYPPNYYQGRTPIQSSYPQYESAEQQNQPTTIIYSRPLITGTREDKSCKFVRIVLALLMLAIPIIFLIIIFNSILK